VNIDVYEALTTSTVITGLTAGAEYKFKVRARNVYGYGPFSEISTLIPDAVPDMMSAPGTTLTYPQVRVSWVSPIDNGNTITSFEILFYSHVENEFLPIS
jgi:hypothetical protein